MTNKLIQYSLITPLGLEQDSEGKIVYHVGKLPEHTDKSEINLRDLIAVSIQNSPYCYGIVTALNVPNFNHTEQPLPMIVHHKLKGNPGASLLTMVRTIGLETGRIKMKAEDH
jgi:hypothetical protein